MDPQLNAAVNAPVNTSLSGSAMGRNALEDSLAEKLAARGASPGDGSKKGKGLNRGRVEEGALSDLCAKSGHSAFPGQKMTYDLHALVDQIAPSPRFDVETNNGLGVRASQIKSPIAHIEAQPVGAVDRSCAMRKRIMDPVKCSGWIVECEIDLARRWKGAPALANEVSQRPFAAHQFGNEKPGYHT